MSSLKVQKTIKLFIGGKFPRTESGRTFSILEYNSQKVFANICQGSIKDFRNSVVCAKSGQKKWSSCTAFLRSQILYRCAEMMQGKSSEISSILQTVQGFSAKDAEDQVQLAIDEFVFYAGFADKYQQLISSLNPVSGSFHNFTAPEPCGVVGFAFAEALLDLPKLVSSLCGILCSGNSIVALLNPANSAVLGVLSEVFATSDVPEGVVNLISCTLDEVLPKAASHMELQSFAHCGLSTDQQIIVAREATSNMKRCRGLENLGPLEKITAFTESKTVWHTIGI